MGLYQIPTRIRVTGFELLSKIKVKVNYQTWHWQITNFRLDENLVSMWWDGVKTSALHKSSWIWSILSSDFHKNEWELEPFCSYENEEISMWTTAKGQNAFDQYAKQIWGWVNYDFLRANSINNYRIKEIHYLWYCIYYQMEKKLQKVRPPLLKRIKLKTGWIYAGLVFIYILYLVIGSLIFSKLERWKELETCQYSAEFKQKYFAQIEDKIWTK